MNRHQVAKLRDHLSEQNPDTEVVVIPQQDGVKVHITGPRVVGGASGTNSCTNVQMRMSDNGPLMRFLRDGHL